MTFDKYINWIIENPESFKFWVSSNTYIIYKVEETNLYEIIKFYTLDNDVHEAYTNLVLCPVNKLNLNKFKELTVLF